MTIEGEEYRPSFVVVLLRRTSSFKVGSANWVASDPLTSVDYIVCEDFNPLSPPSQELTHGAPMTLQCLRGLLIEEPLNSSMELTNVLGRSHGDSISVVSTTSADVTPRSRRHNALRVSLGPLRSLGNTAEKPLLTARELRHVSQGS